MAEPTTGHVGLHETVLAWVDSAALAVEVLSVVVIVGAIISSLVLYLSGRMATGHTPHEAFRNLKVRLGRSLLLGLEILIAADIIRTVALEPTLNNVLMLGLLVLIRTFLSASIIVEMEGRWPWQTGSSTD